MADRHTEEKLHTLAAPKGAWKALALMQPRTLMVENGTSGVVQIAWKDGPAPQPAARLLPGERRPFHFELGFGPDEIVVFADEAGSVWVEESQHHRPVLHLAAPGQAPQPERKTAAIFRLPAPAAPNVAGVHAAHNAAAGIQWPGPIAALPEPRNLRVTFDAAWTGGAVKAVGVDQYGVEVSEAVAPPVGGGVVESATVFSQVLVLVQSQVGVGTASVGLGHKVGVTTPDGSLASTGEVMAFRGATVVPGVAVDAQRDAFGFPTGAPPNGVDDIVVICGHYHNHT